MKIFLLSLANAPEPIKETGSRGEKVTTWPLEKRGTCLGNMSSAASCSDHLLRCFYIKAVQALPCVGKVILLEKELLRFEPANCVPDCPGWQCSFTDEILLGQLSAGLQYFIHKFCRRGQLPESGKRIVIQFCVCDKDDPS